MPQPIQQLISLASDATTWLLALVPVVGGAMFGYHSLAKMVAEGDPARVEHHQRAIRQVLVGTALAESATAIVKFLAGKFAA